MLKTREFTPEEIAKIRPLCTCTKPRDWFDGHFDNCGIRKPIPDGYELAGWGTEIFWRGSWRARDGYQAEVYVYSDGDMFWIPSRIPTSTPG